jgi:Pyruvate/2-oxoacid:ferredoxin oxidoreductase gamma subunit
VSPSSRKKKKKKKKKKKTYTKNIKVVYMGLKKLKKFHSIGNLSSKYWRILLWASIAY